MKLNDVFRRMGLGLLLLCVTLLVTTTGCSMKALQFAPLTVADVDEESTPPEDEITPPENGMNIDGTSLVSADPLGQMIFTQRPLMVARNRVSEIETVAARQMQSYKHELVNRLISSRSRKN
jgi:hypothetical protein